MRSGGQNRYKPILQALRSALALIAGTGLQSMFTGGILVVLCVWLSLKAGIIGTLDLNLKPGDLDLSGSWKIRFDNSPHYASANLDDSTWCLINVPDAGVSARAAATDHPASDCPAEAYPRERMNNSTYWYRKTVVIPAEMGWEKPVLFLGGIKDEGWVYWDGELVSAVRMEADPSLVLLDPARATPGKHVVAIRVHTGGSPYPGIFHNWEMGISILEYARAVQAQTALQREHQETFAILVIHFFALLLTLFLVVRASTANEKTLWLLVYFGTNAIDSLMLYINDGTLRSLFTQNAIFGGAIAVLGLTMAILVPSKARSGRAFLLLGALFAWVALKEVLHRYGYWSTSLDLAAEYAAPAIVLAGILLTAAYRAAHGAALGRIGPYDHAMLWPIIAIQLSETLAPILFGDHPVDLHLPLVRSLLTLAVIAVAIEEHVHKQKELAFFGRFVRQGLRELLVNFKKKALNGDKLFRGRQVSILKIDIIGHTETTFGMPYGIKRIFQDCWFSTIDKIVAKHTFMDKGLGDGSLYYFADPGDGSSCAVAYKAAEAIRNGALDAFDKEFRNRVRALLSATPEIQKPAEDFFSQYAAKTGKDFWTARTQARFVLAFGYVDEGLWGMVSRGHYDIEGDLITVVARLEKAAGNYQLIATEEFVHVLQKRGTETEKLHFHWNEAVLKGIGRKRFAGIETARHLRLAA